MPGRSRSATGRPTCPPVPQTSPARRSRSRSPRTPTRRCSLQPRRRRRTGRSPYTPADDADGTATIGVRIEDNGGTASGGDNTTTARRSPSRSPRVNDPPSFTKGADVSVDEDSGARRSRAGRRTSARAPQRGLRMSVTFTVVADNLSLFAAGPAVQRVGHADLQPAANANGSTDVDVTLSDNGGGGSTPAAPRRSRSRSKASMTRRPSPRVPTKTVAEDAGLQTVPVGDRHLRGPPGREPARTSPSS